MTEQSRQETEHDPTHRSNSPNDDVEQDGDDNDDEDQFDNTQLGIDGEGKQDHDDDAPSHEEAPAIAHPLQTSHTVAELIIIYKHKGNFLGRYALPAGSFLHPLEVGLEHYGKRGSKRTDL